MDKTNKKLYPTNPLGIIALFVFFIEAISASTLYILKDYPNLLELLVIFIIAFPSIIAIMFFIFLWTKPESFFSPTDYKEDSSFLNSIRKEFSFNQKIIKAYTGPPTVIEESYKLADELVGKEEYLEAIRVGRGYLKFNEFYKSYKFFNYLSNKIPSHDEYFPVCIGNIGYSLVGLEKYKEAITTFKSIQEKHPNQLRIWHIAPLTYCSLRLNNADEFNHYLKQLNEHPKLPEEIFEYKKRYPELASHLKVKFEVNN